MANPLLSGMGNPQNGGNLIQRFLAFKNSFQGDPKAKVQELRPVFAVIQPAQMPQYPADSRKKVVLAFMFFGFVLATAWKVFMKDAIAGFREKLKAEDVEVVRSVESDVKAEIQEKKE